MTENVAMLLRMAIAHIVADFILQTKVGILCRRDNKWRSTWLYIHGGVYALLVALAAWSWPSALWLVPVLFVTHVAVDGLKSEMEETAGAYIVDQLLHSLILFLCWMLLSSYNRETAGSFLAGLWQSPQTLLVVGCYLLLVWPSGHIVVNLMRLLDYDEAAECHGLKNAGFWIGSLERVLSFSFILANDLEGIGVLVAVKSIFRFGEIKNSQNRKEVEYILIGSLLSFAIAILLGYLVRAAR